MKYTGLLLFVVIAITSCGNKQEPLKPINKDTTGDFEYEIQNLKDVSMERIGEVRTLITVAKTSGTPQKVLLSGDELPAGLEVFFEPVNGVEASFNTTVVIRSVRAKEGTHKINIKGASPVGGIKNNYVNVTILPYSNAALGLKGDFTEQGDCSGTGSINHNVRVVVDDTVKNRIHIKGLFSSVMTNEIIADIDPATKTLTIPQQEQNEVNYEGDGTYDDDKMVINYTVKGTTLDISCTSTLTRD